MPTDALRLMELMADAVLASTMEAPDPRFAAAFGAGHASHFTAPSAELQEPTVTLDQLLAGRPNLLAALAAHWDEDGDGLPSACPRLIERHLADHPEDAVPATARPAPTDFVYPLV